MFFVAGDYIFSPKVYNEFSPGNGGTGGSWAAHGGLIFPLGGLPLLAEAEYRKWSYPHNQPVAGGCTGGFVGSAAAGTQGCVTVIGGNGQNNVPAFTAVDTDVDGRIGIGIGIPKVYLVGSYLSRWTNYGYPKQTGFGGGVELVPNLTNLISLYGSAIYYPTIGGTYTVTSGPQTGTAFKVQYRLFRYVGGVALSIPSTPIFLEGGVVGDNGSNQSNAPIGFTHQGFFAGLGIHF